MPRPHALAFFGCAILLCALGCATASSRSQLVRERAEFDLGCPAQLITVRELPDDYLDEQLWGGSYEAEGCGTRATYKLDHCGLGAAPNGCKAIAKSGPGVGATNLGEDGEPR